MKTSTFSPALALYFLSPITGALLSGATPPSNFFNPLTLILLLPLYGGGAIICRELTRRWNRGWPTLLALGAAYGVVAEGLMSKSFFDPAWSAAGPVSTYGRWLGVNWAWSLHMVIFHAIFSIAIPVLLVNLIFPARRSEAWVSERTFSWLAGLLALAVVLGFLFLTPYRPPLVPYALTLALVVVLVAVASQLPTTFVITKNTSVAAPYIFGALGFLATLIFFIVSRILPYTFLPAPVSMFCMIALAFYVGKTVLEMSGNATRWQGEHQLALAGGALAFYIVLAPLLEWFPSGRNTAGMTMVALIASAGLVCLAWLIHVRERQNT
jgi:hypothetical protein